MGCPHVGGDLDGVLAVVLARHEQVHQQLGHDALARQAVLLHGPGHAVVVAALAAAPQNGHRPRAVLVKVALLPRARAAGRALDREPGLSRATLEACPQVLVEGVLCRRLVGAPHRGKRRPADNDRPLRPDLARVLAGAVKLDLDVRRLHGLVFACAAALGVRLQVDLEHGQGRLGGGGDRLALVARVVHLHSPIGPQQPVHGEDLGREHHRPVARNLVHVAGARNALAVLLDGRDQFDWGAVRHRVEGLGIVELGLRDGAALCWKSKQGIDNYNNITNAMAQLTVPAEPAPGVTIGQADGKITITITPMPPSNNHIDTDWDDNGEDDNVPSSQSEVQKLLCAAPLRPPSLPPPLDGLPGVFEGLYDWVLEQDAYERWRKARRAEDTDSDDRVLWVCGPEGYGMTMVLQVLAQVEGKDRDEDHAGLPQHVVAHAFWDWTRDAYGTSVVSVVRDLVWSLIIAQPTLQSHLEHAVMNTGRCPLLGDGNVDDNEHENKNENDTEARHAALGTSGDFYALLALLCSIVQDQLFEPTLFVVDHMDVLLGEEDSDETHKDGQSGASHTALRREWTRRDLFALIDTTCRLSGKVSWVVASSSSLGGCCLNLKPEDPTLGKVTRLYARALLLNRPTTTYSTDMLDQLVSGISQRSDLNLAWTYLAVDLLNAVRLPWNAIATLERLPDSSTGLGPLLDWIVQDASSDRAHVDIVLSVAARAFRPLMIAELDALAELPATVDAAVLIKVVAWPLLELRRVDDGRGNSLMCVYFRSRAVLAAQRARLAKDTAAPNLDAKLHADMARRHLRCLVRHYDKVYATRSGNDDGKGAGHGQLSLYMKFAWLRHLHRVDFGHPDDPLTDDVCRFAKRYADAWICDLEALGVLAVARSLLQDLISPDHQLPSPIKDPLQTIFASIARQKVTGMSFVDTNRFLHMVGHKPNTQDDDMPVLPQDPPIPLQGMLSLGSDEMSASAAHIATLEGHTDWVRDTYWSYDGRLLVSISDDGTLRVWDRASLRMQHIASHQLPGYPLTMAVCKDPSILVAIGSRGIVHLNLAAGAILITKKSHDEVVEEMRVQKAEEGKNGKNGGEGGDEGDAADEELQSFANLRIVEDGPNDVIVTCVAYGAAGPAQTQEVILAMPGLSFKEVRRKAYGYNSLPSNLASKLPASECKHVDVATELEVAAVLHTKGYVDIYDTHSAARLHTLRCAQGVFTSVWYDALWRLFLTSDEGDGWTAYFVQERVEKGEGEERGMTKPLIRSYRAPGLDLQSYCFSRDRAELVLTSRNNVINIHKVMGLVDIVDDDAASAERASDVSSTGDMHGQGPVNKFTSTLVSHNGLRAATANDDGQIQLWNLNASPIEVKDMSGAHGATLLRTFKSSQSEINWLSFSSDDVLLLSCYDNGEIHVWDTDVGARVAVLGGHKMWVHFAVFAQGDTLVGTISCDGLVRLWDLAACRALYLEKDGDVAASFEEDDRKPNDNNDDHGSGNEGGNEGGNDNATAHTTKRTFVSIKSMLRGTTGTVALSPDGRFLATPGGLGHIWNISPAPDSVLPAGSPKLYCEDRDGGDDRWQPRATVLAHGFAIPDSLNLWPYAPRRLSISGTEGQYLLHSEIGVWTLPSSPWPMNADGKSNKMDKVGLRPSPHHPCTVVHTGSHVAILWQDRLVAPLPKTYAPHKPYYFSGYTCAAMSQIFATGDDLSRTELRS
ncbi:nacht and wd40 domain protein [Ophiostoma piceae UAMH 11346]|uniref:Nacht and wd40 domain protein n=1 Tax=Ophiostoma piceae (strain UAMH 11346) TaxID=1262450 RepID=S3C4I9_OPHP1|nr:nacht and wd40 domain protein [Ophiostoma piceae UAMH 11346]